MKRSVFVVIAALSLAAAPAMADSLNVVGVAAMGGTNYGMELSHDNSSQAFVQDNTPSSETVYRATFLFNAQNVSFSGSPTTFRQVLFQAYGPNPNPGVGVCSANPAAQIGSIRLWLFQVAGGTQSSLQLWARGNQCGERSTTRFNINNNQDYRVCLEWETGASSTGRLALAVVDAAAACPTSGGPGWAEETISNNLTVVDFVRMGTPATNNFGAGETMTLYFDEFESYRTVTP